MKMINRGLVLLWLLLCFSVHASAAWQISADKKNRALQNEARGWVYADHAECRSPWVLLHADAVFIPDTGTGRALLTGPLKAVQDLSLLEAESGEILSGRPEYRLSRGTLMLSDAGASFSFDTLRAGPGVFVAPEIVLHHKGRRLLLRDVRIVSGSSEYVVFSRRRLIRLPRSRHGEGSAGLSVSTGEDEELQDEENQ